MTITQPTAFSNNPNFSYDIELEEECTIHIQNGYFAGRFWKNVKAITELMCCIDQHNLGSDNPFQYLLKHLETYSAALNYQ